MFVENGPHYLRIQFAHDSARRHPSNPIAAPRRMNTWFKSIVVLRFVRLFEISAQTKLSE